MSTITKISSSREETDSYASEERKIEMRRRMQLQARGKASLSLSSLEELAGQQHTGAYLKNMRFRSTACLPDLDESIVENKTFSDQATDIVDSSVLLKFSRFCDAKEEHSNCSDSRKKTNLVFANIEDDRKILEKKSSVLNPPNDREKLFTESEVTEKHLMRRSNEELKVEETDQASSNLSRRLTTNFEDILQNVQILVDDVGLVEDVKEKAISGIFSNDSNLRFAQGDMAKAMGNIRFLNAFIEGFPMEHPYRDELLAGLKKFYEAGTAFEDSRDLDIHFETGNSEERKEIQFADDEVLKDKSIESNKKDLDAIYLYLEAITATSASSTFPVMLERFSKVLKSTPDQAIQRLAVLGTGIDTIEVVAREAERRLNKLSEKIEAVAQKSAKTTILKNAILDEREKLKSALMNFEQFSNFRTARQIAEKEQERIRTETTLPSLIAKSY